MEGASAFLNDLNSTDQELNNLKGRKREIDASAPQFRIKQALSSNHCNFYDTTGSHVEVQEQC